MIAEAMEKVRAMCSMKPVTVDGKTYWDVTGKEIEQPPKTVERVAEVKSLDALISAFEAPELFGVAEAGECQIVVSDARRVSVVSPPHNRWSTRDEYISATWSCESFPFGRYMDIEEFIIKSQCHFFDSDVKRAMIAHVSSIRGEDVRSNVDDGISQTVVTENRLGRKENAEFSPMLSLSPYRTFPEVLQPSSLFLLRMRKGREAPEVALYEADGGLWVSRAVRNVATYLRSSEVIQAAGIAVIG